MVAFEFLHKRTIHTFQAATTPGNFGSLIREVRRIQKELVASMGKRAQLQLIGILISG